MLPTDIIVKLSISPVLRRKKKMDYTPEFMSFWRKYPGRYHEAGRPKAGGGYEHYWKIGKRKAAEEWDRLTDYDHKWAMYAVGFMRPGRFVPDAFRWLKDGKYEDIDIPEERPTTPTKLLPKMKIVESVEVNVNNERNQQKNKLGVR